MQHPSILFLMAFRPSGPWTLTCIPPDGGRTSTATFSPKRLDRLESWLGTHQDKNIYFAVNPAIEEMDKKTSREDIACVEYLHVDVDPDKSKPIADEQQRILSMLQSTTPAPTCIIFSGGGYQAFWKLAEPIQIGGQLALAEEAKRYNVQLEILYGGDNCHNIDRIMRLPGTMNRPNAKKRAAGRVEVMAELVSFCEANVYPLSMFAAAQPVQDKSAAGFSSHAAALEPNVSGNIKRLASVDELPDTIKPWVKVLICQGNDPDDPTRWPSRSERLFAVCCELVRGGVPDDVIYSVVTDPDFKISESVIELGSRAEAYALRQIRSAKEVAIAPELREMNEKHAVISSIGGKCLVISQEWDHALDRSVIKKQTFEDIRNRYMHRPIRVGTDKNGIPVTVPMGKWWLENPLRTQYDTIEFVPGREIPGCYNMWRGFTCEARPGKIDKFLAHVREIICGGCEYYYDYLIKWMASTVQQPAQVGSTAVVLRGKQGTGKSFFVKQFGRLFGEHFLPITNSKHLVGSFNAHLRNCVLLFADEAFFAGDRKNESILKGLITEDHLVIEPKHVDSEIRSNFLHVMMASNSEWVVPAAMDDRRFFVLDVGDAHREDTGYFAAIQREMDNGGYEGLLHHLMNMPLGDFDVRIAPKTEALHDQKELNLSPEEAWWYDKLQDGRLLPGHEKWERHAPRDATYTDYLNYVRAYMGGTYMNRCSKHRLSKFLGRVCPVGFPRLASVNMPPTEGCFDLKPVCYEFPDLVACRNKWEEIIGCASKWQIVEDTVQGPESPF